MSSTPLLDQWLATLPEKTREIIALAGETVEKLDGNVKMAEVLASLSFMQAVEAANNPEALSPRDRTELFKMAGSLNKLAIDMKQQRLDVMDKYENISDVPRPAALEYLVVETGLPEQIRRLLALGMTHEANMLCEQNDLALEDFVTEPLVLESPDEQ